ncbi:MAG TPA: hypothetical protein VGK67_27700 [Myxococcales bacterium]|jgi:hypothetical protein
MPNPLKELSTFVAGLPNGLESYPECLVKGTIVRSFLLDCVPVATLEAAALPQPVAALLRTPPLNSVWASEVEFFGALLAVRDLLGLDDAAWKRWFESRNHQALTNPVLRLVMNFTSAEMLLSLSQAYWGMTHKGSRMTTIERASHTATMLFEHPRGLVNADVGVFLTVALAVPLALSRAKSPSVVMQSSTPTGTIFKATWK